MIVSARTTPTFTVLHVLKVSQVFHHMLHGVRSWWIERCTLRRVASLDDHLLRDIGLEPDEVRLVGYRWNAPTLTRHVGRQSYAMTRKPYDRA